MTRDAADTQPTSPLRNPVLIIMMLASFTSVLNGSMVNVAIPVISHGLDVSAGLSGWIITAYSIVFATGVALYGRVSDSYSLRVTFMAALAIFGLASLICALAPTFNILVAGRALQAAGAAAIPSLSLGTVTRLYPAGQRGVVFGMISSAVGIGAATGPLAGGFGVGMLGWRVLFFGTLFVLVFLLIGAWRFLPDLERTPERARGRFARLDLPGGLLLALSAATLLAGVTSVARAGIGNPITLVLLGCALSFVAAFAARIRLAIHPFAPPALFANRGFMCAACIALLSQAAFIGCGLFLTPLMLINEQQLTALQTGLVVAPGAILIALTAPSIGRLSDRLGPTIMLGSGLLVLLLGLLFLSSFGTGASPWIVSGALMVASIGYVSVTTPAANAASSALSTRIAGVGFGIYQLFFFLGSGSGAAVFGSVLSARQQAGSGALNPIYQGSPALTGYSDGYLVACAGLVLAMVALLGLRRTQT